ncbi:flagellin-specific chaperone FliS [Peribacillus asahii]|uniref:Flagellin-specific chaperone FliS n=1 Tax=Peribacillus asahii TaxID=228899 RepID=A0A3Q9RRM7_9BACI|nr:flagellar export chaperone FliS [Peribacillus asahii]AZV45260.1 flagellin-specific chaperone FliS [Peribacillus asahii]
MEFLSEEMIYQKTPQELTAFLYEGLIENLEQAITLIEKKDYIESNKKLQKANDILHRLGVGLKYEAGPIAEQLDRLYNFMADELVEANLKKDAEKIQGVLKIVGEIASAWNIALKKTPNPTQKINRKVAAYESSVMRINQ